MIRDIDIHLIRTFVITADLASMTLAARSLNKTQGAISQQVKRLEELLGTDLFHRERSGLRLTRDAERLLPKARRFLALNDEIWSDMTMEAVRGHVRLGIPDDLVGCFAAPILKSYGQAFPEVEVSLECGSSSDLLGRLADGAIDIVIAEEPMTAITGECLRIERLVWVGAKGGEAHLRSPLPVSMVAESCMFRAEVLKALESVGKAWRTLFESGNIEATAATVRADLAISVFLASFVPSNLDILSPSTDLPALPSFAITLHLHNQQPAPAVAELALHIRNTLPRFAQALESDPEVQVASS